MKCFTQFTPIADGGSGLIWLKQDKCSEPALDFDGPFCSLVVSDQTTICPSSSNTCIAPTANHIHAACDKVASNWKKPKTSLPLPTAHYKSHRVRAQKTCPAVGVRIHVCQM